MRISENGPKLYKAPVNTAQAKRAAAAKKKRLANAGKILKPSADRLAGTKKTSVAADKASGTFTQRSKQNAGTKDGTVRLGAKGKRYNVYDAMTSSWKRGKVVGESTKGTISYRGIRKPTDGMVGPAVVGVKNPTNGQVYRFGPPNSRENFRWNSRTKKFTKVK
jgi:hypothetical protein